MDEPENHATPEKKVQKGRVKGKEGSELAKCQEVSCELAQRSVWFMKLA